MLNASLHGATVTFCPTPDAALDAWDTDPRCLIVAHPAGSRYAVGHEQAVDFFCPGWHHITVEDLEGRGYEPHLSAGVVG